MTTDETPKTEEKKSWVKIKPAEVEKLVVDMAKEGLSPARIGLVLRDKHGIPKAKLLGKKVVQILKDADADYDTDKARVDRKIDKLTAHWAKNKHDYSAQRSLAKQRWAQHHLKDSE